MKSLIKNRKLIVILALSLFFLINTFALTNALAITMQDDAVFNLDKEDPLGPEGYGAIVPSPNTVASLFVDGVNQGKFTVTNWLGGTLAEEIVSYPGEDISLYYPTDLDNYGIGSFTLTGDIDPWNEVRWLNVSAYNAEAETLSPFSVSSVFDYYKFQEGGVFTQPFNYEHIMQVDIIIKSGGPKVLKLDWLTANPGAVGYMHFLVAPSGKMVDYYEEEANFQGGPTLNNYLIFVANEIGAYRFIIYASHTDPASLNLEFLDIDISSLTVNSVKFGGNFDDFATLDVSKTAMWQSNWFRFGGKKGEVFTVDIFQDFSTGFTPTIDIWAPSVNGYFLQTVGTGSHDIYFAKNGYAYVSLTDVDFGDWYRYSLFLTKATNEKYTLGDKTIFSISMDEMKTVEFTVPQDSIVRFNYTSFPNPAGAPALNSLGTANAFIFRDSAEFVGYDINTALLTRTVDSTNFRWHYMPRGTYKAIIENTNPLANGLFQISSQVYGWSEEEIPVNSLTYPITYPTEFMTAEFEPDPEFISLKNPLGIEIEIPDIGQFILNTTVYASDISGIASGIPSHLYTLNDTDLNFYTSDYPYPAFSTDGTDSEVNDYLYIGAPTRWTGMTFDFSVLGVGGSIADPLVYTDPGWDFISLDNEGTTGFTADGTIELDISDGDFDNWVKGADDDIDSDLDEFDYYWMAIRCSGDYSTVPIIQQLSLLNLTIRGDLQYILIGENGYQYDDYWGPAGITQPTDATPPTNDIVLSLDNDDGQFYHVYTRESSIIQSLDPETIGFEPGTYKLLVIPENWDYNGTVSVQFAVENFWSYQHQKSFDIVNEPNLHAIDITNYTLTGYSNLTGPSYPYDLITSYNHTEAYVGFTFESYFAIECTGKPYQWTQVVVVTENVSDYELYILQDLPWVDPTVPNGEVTQISPTNVNYNTTYEFGAFSEHFTLLFEVNAPLDDTNVTFYLSLRQYDTEMLTTKNVRASYTPPLPPILIIVLAIAIPSAVGAAVLVYILKRKGKISSKRPT